MLAISLAGADTDMPARCGWGLSLAACGVCWKIHANKNRPSDTGIMLATKQMCLIRELMYASAPDLGLLGARGLCTLLRFAGSPPGGLGIA